MRKKQFMALTMLLAATCMAGGCGKKADSERIMETTHEEKPQSTVREEKTETKIELGETTTDSRTLHLEITPEYDSDWEENHKLIGIKTSQVHLLDEEHGALQSALDALNQKNLNEQNAFMRENQEDARWMYQENAEMMDGWESEVTVSAVRADEKVLSLIQTEYSWMGGAHPNTYIRGICYDTATGKELSLRDICADYDGLYQFVCQKLKEESEPNMLFDDYETTVKEMFYGGNSEANPVQWFLTDRGVTIQFNPYDIAPYAAGPIAVEIPFSEQAGLFDSQYESTKTAYALNMQEYETVELDVNGDGQKEAISYSVDRDEDGIGGAITVTCGDASFCTASLMEQDFQASGGYSSEGYLLQTEAGKTYLYLQHQSDNDSKYMNIFDLNHDTPVYLGSCDRSWSGSPITDPENFLLWDREDVLGTYSAYRVYRVGANGMPESDDTLYRIGIVHEKEYPIVLTSTRSFDVTIVESASEKTETMPVGTSFSITGTDGKSFVETKLSDGRICHIPVSKEADGWEWKIDGISEYDCFEQVPYAG